MQLIGPIAPDALTNRNTFVRAEYDADGRLIGFDKMVYGEVELSHRYTYRPDGLLSAAEIIMLDEEPVTLRFDAAGNPVPAR